MKLLAIIPAKRHSERIIHKNMQLINDRAMIDYTFEAARDAQLFDKVLVVTDDLEVRRLAHEQGFDATAANDEVFKGRVWRACQAAVQIKSKEEFTHFCLLLPTNPLRKAEDIVNGWSYFGAVPEPDYVASVTEYSFNAHYALRKIGDGNRQRTKVDGLDYRYPYLGPLLYDVDIDQGREKFGPTYFMDGAVYWAKIEAFIRNRWRISPTNPNTLFFQLPRERAYEVDTKFDLKVVRALMKEQEW